MGFDCSENHIAIMISCRSVITKSESVAAISLELSVFSVIFLGHLFNFFFFFFFLARAFLEFTLVS